MSKKIFYKEYLSNDKELKKPIYLRSGDKGKFEGDGQASSRNNKICKIKKVRTYYFSIFIHFL